MKNCFKILAALSLAILLLASTACSKPKEATNDSEYEKVSLSANWAYNYGSVKELAEACDIAAYVKIKDLKFDDSYSSYGVKLTVYTAEICESLYGKEKGEIQIVMTGGIDESEKKIYEIADDPLMKKNDEFFIFARQNEDGTYTVLSGSQGRFEIVDNKVSSLNVSNTQVADNNLSSNIKVDQQDKAAFYAEISEYVGK